MNCFAHRDSPAIAICKTCGRAVCSGCAIDLGFAIACREECRKDASDLQQMNAKAKRIYGLGSNRKLSPMAPLIWTLLATPFVYLLISQYLRRGVIEWFALIFVLAAALIGFLSWRRTKAIEVNC